jgi:hypothetical protein
LTQPASEVERAMRQGLLRGSTANQRNSWAGGRREGELHRAVTLVDRLIHRAEAVEIDAESYRLEEAKKLNAARVKQRAARRSTDPLRSPVNFTASAAFFTGEVRLFTGELHRISALPDDHQHASTTRIARTGAGRNARVDRRAH